MEEIKYRYNQIVKAVDTMKESLELITENVDKGVHRAYQDSVIQRFKYTTDIFWKFLKLLLQKKGGIDIQINAPRDILQEAYNIKLLSQEQYNIFTDAITDRNSTSHTYNEEIAEEIVSRLPRYYENMRKFLDTIQL